MSETEIFTKQVRKLIDDFKSVCANYGLGNDGNEFKIITQIFLFSFTILLNHQVHKDFLISILLNHPILKEISLCQVFLSLDSPQKTDLQL